MSVKLTDREIRSVQRPVHSLWSKLVLYPISVPLGKWVINQTNFSPLFLTWAAMFLSLVSAAMFLQATPMALAGGVIAFQLSTLLDTLDGMVARAKSGSGSMWGVVLDHVLDTWRSIFNVLALALGQYNLDGDPTHVYLAAAFLAVHFTDWIEPDTIHRVRAVLVPSKNIQLNRLDRSLLALKNRLQQYGLRVMFFSIHEREVCVFVIGPLFAIVDAGFLCGIALTALFFIFRLRFDVALLRSEISTGEQEYLGDSQNTWEQGHVTNRSAESNSGPFTKKE